MNNQQLYKVFYLNGNKKQYCSQSCEDFVDDRFSDFENGAGKFVLRVANRLIKQSRLNLLKELYTRHDN